MVSIYLVRMDTAVWLFYIAVCMIPGNGYSGIETIRRGGTSERVTIA